MTHKEIYIEFEGLLRRVLSLDGKVMVISKDGRTLEIPTCVTELYTMTYFLN